MTYYKTVRKCGQDIVIRDQCIGKVVAGSWGVECSISKIQRYGYHCAAMVNDTGTFMIFIAVSSKD